MKRIRYVRMGGGGRNSFLLEKKQNNCSFKQGEAERGGFPAKVAGSVGGYENASDLSRYGVCWGDHIQNKRP